MESSQAGGPRSSHRRPPLTDEDIKLRKNLFKSPLHILHQPSQDHTVSHNKSLYKFSQVPNIAMTVPSFTPALKPVSVPSSDVDFGATLENVNVENLNGG